MSCARGCCATPAEHYRSLRFTPRPSEATLRERRWERDMPAYKRLRQQGYQPPRIDGSGDLEQVASMPQEITLGRRITDPNERSLATELID